MTDTSGFDLLLIWLENSPVADSLRQSMWLYPAVEITHITGFAILVGAAVMYDLRLIGLSRQIRVTDATQHLSVWARLSLFAVIPSGLLLFITDATSLASNIAFRIKLILIMAAIGNAVVFHSYTLKTVQSWNQDTSTPLSAKAAGILSIILWISVITCGRLIAYL